MTSPTGNFVWYEYIAEDRKAAVDFYSHVVGWSAKDAGMAGFPYELVGPGEHRIGGITDIPADARAMGARPGWDRSIWVEDVDASAKKLGAEGGQLMKGPVDMPNVGRFAVVAAPFGAVFILFRDAGGDARPPQPAGTPRLG